MNNIKLLKCLPSNSMHIGVRKLTKTIRDAALERAMKYSGEASIISCLSNIHLGLQSILLKRFVNNYYFSL